LGRRLLRRLRLWGIVVIVISTATTVFATAVFVVILFPHEHMGSGRRRRCLWRLKYSRRSPAQQNGPEQPALLNFRHLVRREVVSGVDRLRVGEEAK
jgi:hypothetical protein